MDKSPVDLYVEACRVPRPEITLKESFSNLTYVSVDREGGLELKAISGDAVVKIRPSNVKELLDWIRETYGDEVYYGPRKADNLDDLLIRALKILEDTCDSTDLYKAIEHYFEERRAQCSETSATTPTF